MGASRNPEKQLALQVAQAIYVQIAALSQFAEALVAFGTSVDESPALVPDAQSADGEPIPLSAAELAGLRRREDQWIDSPPDEPIDPTLSDGQRYVIAVLRVVSRPYFRVSLYDIVNRDRTLNVAGARRNAMWLLATQTTLGQLADLQDRAKAIATFFDMSPVTVNRYIKEVTHQIRTNRHAASHLTELARQARKEAGESPALPQPTPPGRRHHRKEMEERHGRRGSSCPHKKSLRKSFPYL